VLRPLARRVLTLATLLLATLLCGLSLGAAPAQAHGLGDPAVRTVLDGVQPALPVGVGVDVRPSVVDELVLTNSTPVPMEVLARGGEAFLRLSSGGVQANLASPDWYTTGNPEGGAPVPPGVRGGRSTPRFVQVSALSTWAEFDPRLHPSAWRRAVPALRRRRGPGQHRQRVLGRRPARPRAAGARWHPRRPLRPGRQQHDLQLARTAAALPLRPYRRRPSWPGRWPRPCSSGRCPSRSTAPRRRSPAPCSGCRALSLQASCAGRPRPGPRAPPAGPPSPSAP